MIYLFHGEDDYSIACALQDLSGALGDESIASLNTTRLDGRSVNMDDIIQACEAMPFLAERRLVIVQGLFDRLSPRAPAKSVGGERKGRAESPLEGALRAYLPQVPETAILVFVENAALDKTNAMLAAVKDVRGSVREFAPLKSPALTAWIETRVATAQGRILPAAVQTLAAFVGSDLRRLSSEIDKLLSYAGGRAIDETMVELLVADAREARIFDLTDAVAARQVDRALRVLHQLSEEGSAPPVIMVMLTRQVRILTQVKELVDRGISAAAIATQLKLHPFVAEKSAQQARSLTPARLDAMYGKLLEADIAMKGARPDEDITLRHGRLDPATALDLLIVDLARRG